ncbi:hypothetical protein ABPG72_011804 [Tetrahymena utriculariae]
MSRKVKQNQDSEIQKPQPPKSAFYHFLEEASLKIKQKDPKSKQSTIAKKAKEMFQNLTDEEIQKYNLQEEKELEKYKKDYAEYKKKKKEDVQELPNKTKKTQESKSKSKSQDKSTSDKNDKEVAKKEKEPAKQAIKKEPAKQSSSLTFTVRYCSG